MPAYENVATYRWLGCTWMVWAIGAGAHPFRSIDWCRRGLPVIAVDEVDRAARDGPRSDCRPSAKVGEARRELGCFEIAVSERAVRRGCGGLCGDGLPGEIGVAGDGDVERAGIERGLVVTPEALHAAAAASAFAVGSCAAVNCA